MRSKINARLVASATHTRDCLSLRFATLAVEKARVSRARVFVSRCLRELRDGNPCRRRWVSFSRLMPANTTSLFLVRNRREGYLGVAHWVAGGLSSQAGAWPSNRDFCRGTPQVWALPHEILKTKHKEKSNG